MNYFRYAPHVIEGMISLKVGNLTYRTTSEDLREIFSKYGKVGDVYVPKNRYSGDSRGFAFVSVGDGTRPPPKIDGMISLKVDNLTYRTTTDDLRKIFERCGEVGDIYIPRDRFTHESRGFAFVRFYDRRDAEDALDAMDGRILDGRELRVQMARYGRPNSPRYGGGRNSYRRRSYGRRSYDRYERRRSYSRSYSRSRSRSRRRSRSPSGSRSSRSYSKGKSVSRSKSPVNNHNRSKSASN